MFKLRLAKYINDGLVEHNMSYKDLSRMSGVPPTTLSYYARGQVNTPNDEYCAKIAAAFGDSSDVIQQMRREAIGSTAAENNLVAASDDQERMEKFVVLMRSNMSAILEEYRIQAAAQQTEILDRADKRVANEETRFRERLDEVSRQYRAELNKELAHAGALLESEKEHREELRKRNEDTRKYLKIMVRNLTIALVVVTLVLTSALIAFASYSFYAYHTFDRQDPTKGLYQEEIPQTENYHSTEDSL